MSPDKSPSTNLSIDELVDQFSNSSSRKQRALSIDLEERSEELIQIQSAGLDSYDPEEDDWKAGWILQVINRHQPHFLEKVYSVETSGWFKASSAIGINLYGANTPISGLFQRIRASKPMILLVSNPS